MGMSRSPQKEAAERRQSVQSVQEDSRKSSVGVINRRQSVTNYDLIDALSKKKIIDNRVDMDTIRHHVDRLRIEEERSRLPQRKEEDEGEESFEEVIGSGLTSETEGQKATTPKSKPKTIPGHRL